MRPIIEGPPAPGEAPKPLHRRLAWFIALWVVSLVAAVAIVSALRMLIL